MDGFDSVNCLEEQNDEITALEAIYYKEFEMLSESPFYKFEIIVRYQPQDSISETCTERFSGILPFIVLRFEYTERYPLEIPSFELVKSKHLQNEELEHIHKNLLAEAERCIGTVMVYNIIVAAQENINSILDAVLTEQAKQKEKNSSEFKRAAEIRAEEEEFKRKMSSGRRVTPELFEEWRKQFEMEVLMKDKLHVDNEKKSLTGRELFQTNTTLNMSDLQFMEDVGDDDVVVDESLFCNDDELLDDLPDQ